MAMPIIHWCVDWLVAEKMPNGDQQNSDKQFMAMPIICWCVDWLMAAKMPNGDQQNWDKQFPAMPIVRQCVDWLVAAKMPNGDWQNWDKQFPATPIIRQCVDWLVAAYMSNGDQQMRWTIPGNADHSSTRWLLNYFQLLQEHCLPNVPGRILINVDCCVDIWTYKNLQPFQWQLPIDCQVTSNPEFWGSMCTSVHFKWICKVDCRAQW